MSRVTTFTGYPDTLLPSELNDVQDDYGAAVAHATLLHRGAMQPQVGGLAATGGQYQMGYPGNASPITSNQFIPWGSGIFPYNPEMWTTLNGQRLPRVKVLSSFSKFNAPTGQSYEIRVSRVTASGGANAGASGIGGPLLTATDVATGLVSGSTADSQGQIRASAVINSSGWTPGWYILKFVGTGTLGGTGAYSLQTQIIAFAQ